jgi:hypothetical protein
VIVDGEIGYEKNRRCDRNCCSPLIDVGAESGDASHTTTNSNACDAREIIAILDADEAPPAKKAFDTTFLIL